jgi:serine/threonine protein kinase
MTGCQACGASNIDTARFCAECGKPIEKPIETGLSALHTIDPALAQQKPDGDGGKSLFDLKPGEIFADRYRIVEEIGRGGMGVVYRVHDPVTQRDVALKLIRGDRLAGKDAVKRLVREGVLARDIRHPNVVAVYDVGEVKGLPFLTMEMLGGGSLRAWMQKQMRQGEEATMATAANIIREVLHGLAAAHAQGVIHRDLKPENIVLLGEPNDREARLKILDFGIARAGGGSETGSTSLGTLEYMSPEQLTAPEAAQASADFYSLSVMFYELLIGVVPKGHWQPPSGGRSDVPPAIDKLIERGLSNAPRQRQQNAQQYLAELEAALGGQTAAPQPSPAPKPGPAPKPAPDPAPQPKPQPAPSGENPFMAVFKNMTPMKMGIIAVVVLLVIGGWVSSVLEKAEDEKPETSIASNNNGQSNNQNGNQPNNQGNINTGPVFNPPPNQPLQPVQPQAANPPPDPSNYGVLSGYWIDSKGNRAQISVSLYGELEGQFTGGDLTGYGIAGEFSGTLLQYVIGTDAQGVIGGGVAEWSDICHVIYPDVDMNGAPNGRMVTFHVNHTTDMKCF